MRTPGLGQGLGNSVQERLGVLHERVLNERCPVVGAEMDQVAFSHSHAEDLVLDLGPRDLGEKTLVPSANLIAMLAMPSSLPPWSDITSGPAR